MAWILVFALLVIVAALWFTRNKAQKDSLNALTQKLPADVGLMSTRAKAVGAEIVDITKKL